MIALNRVKYVDKIKDNLIVLFTAILFTILLVSAYKQDSIIVNTGTESVTTTFNRDTIYGSGGW